MLTHVGETVSIAMTELATMNKEIADLHKELAELETQIQGAEEVEAEVEPVANETSK
jgi:cell division septum initiation protein DivIVA